MWIIIVIVGGIIAFHAVERHENYRDYKCQQTHTQWDCR